MKVTSLFCCALAATVLLTACGNNSGSDAGTTAGSATARIATPAAVKSAGQLVFCSDMTFPPFEFTEGGTPKGADIELGQQVAKLMGSKATFDQTGFDGIVAAIQSHKCDAIVNGLYETPERKQVLGFASYARVGQAVLVRKGDPSHVGGVEGLSGKTVAVQVGTANRDYLKHVVNARFRAQGKPETNVVAFPQNNDAVNALRTDRVDAYFAGTPEIAYLSTQQPGQFEIAGDQVGTAVIGIAVRKSDTELHDAIQRAVKMLYADGTAQRILAHWGLRDAILKQ